MARLVPDDVAEPNQGPWHASERATLNKLAVMLPQEFTVFHGIHWAECKEYVLMHELLQRGDI